MKMTVLKTDKQGLYKHHSGCIFNGSNGLVEAKMIKESRLKASKNGERIDDLEKTVESLNHKLDMILGLLSKDSEK